MRAISAPTNAARFAKFAGQFSPRPRAACDERPALPNAGAAPRPKSNRNAPPGQAPRRNDTRPTRIAMGCPEQRRSLRCSRDGRRIVAGVDAALAACGSNSSTRQSPAGIALQMLLEAALIELRVTERSESGVSPRSIRISLSCPVMQSLARPNRTFRANSSPCSASRSTSPSGSPLASRFVIKSMQL